MGGTFYWLFVALYLAHNARTHAHTHTLKPLPLPPPPPFLPFLFRLQAAANSTFLSFNASIGGSGDYFTVARGGFVATVALSLAPGSPAAPFQQAIPLTVSPAPFPGNTLLQTKVNLTLASRQASGVLAAAAAHRQGAGLAGGSAALLVLCVSDQQKGEGCCVIPDASGGTCVAAGIALTVAPQGGGGDAGAGWSVLAQYKGGVNVSTNLLSKSGQPNQGGGPFFQQWTVGNATANRPAPPTLGGDGAMELAVQCTNLAPPTPAPTPTPVSQCDVLMDLYDATGGSSWRSNDNWGTGDCCTNNWYGVTCASGAVTEL